MSSSPARSAYFPADIYIQRISSFTDLLAKSGISAAIITSGPDTDYLLGQSLDTHERISALLVSPHTYPTVIAPGVDAHVLPPEQAEALGITVLTWEDSENPYEKIEEALNLNEQSTLGISASMTADHVLKLGALTGKLYNATEILAQQFMRKSADEVLELLAVGAAIDAVHAQVPELLIPGRTEREVASDIEQLILKNHASVDFIIVGSGPHGALPHHSFSDRKIQKGDIVVVDIGGSSDSGYHSDCTRTYSVGTQPEDIASQYQVLLEAQEAGYRAVSPGVTAAYIDKVVRDHITHEGLGQYFIHRTGHGIGLSTHEEPFIQEGNDLVLEPGMAFSIEPGIYIPDHWGARIEDIVVVTDTGAQRLNNQPRELINVAL